MFFRFASAFLTLCIIFAATLSSSHAAKIYRWVDENGMAHYSQNPPREHKSESVNIRAASKGTPSSSNIAAEKARQERKEAKTEEEDKKEETTPKQSPEEMAKFCQQSRTLLQQMNGNTNRRFEQDDGSYRKLTQEEIAGYKSQAQEGIQSYCK